MSLEAWQTALRREFGRTQRFLLRNIGAGSVFSEFTVTNPKTKGTYRVAIRGQNPGDNYCACPDFAVNTLGTCKHIEFTLARLERQRGGRAALAAGFQPDYSEVFLRYGAKREVAFRPGRRCPPAIGALASRYFGPEGFLKPSAYGHFESFLKDARSDGHELRCYGDALTFIAQVRDEARRREAIQALLPRGAASSALEKLLKVPLYPYQRQGALFAATAGRCLLADEMGLGKTIQAVAAAEILARAAGVERVLVVCPTSLKHQWRQEIGKFTDRSAAVVFSQWLRMHDLIVRRLTAHRWPHVLFHGGIPGRQRGDLIRRFTEDPRCRLFLSTDAGGVGLNLQNATVVVNMDQPWNPAVLEQRIGRVHRLGQHRPVRVVNFVAQGTIEHGMLSLLSFKKSLFAGVLDGGEDQVLLGGTRLKRFMESVEKTTGSIPAPMPRETAESQAEASQGLKEARAEEEADGDGRAAHAVKPEGPTAGLADLLTAGLSFLDTLGKALGAGKPGSTERRGDIEPADSFIGRDEKTGQAYLKLPVPSGETLKKIADALGTLAQAFRPGS